MENILKDIRRELSKESSKKGIESSLRFFKERIAVYGVSIPLVRSLSKKYFKHIKGLGKKEIFKFCEELLKSGYLEETLIASYWTYSLRKDFEKEDIYIFESWIEKYINNWATCDDFCNHTVGSYIEMFPEQICELKEWAESDSRWVRRASAVSLIAPARKGMFIKDIFDIADVLLLDREDMVQKGYGWLLKVASGSYERDVFDYVMKNKTIMPRTSLRYAIEKMPQELRKQAIKRE